MRRFLFAASMGLLTVLMLASPALAARSWCAKDPIVRLNGADVQIWVAIPEEYVQYVNGPIETKVQIPAAVSHSLVFMDDGFNGYGESLKFGTLDTKVSKNGMFDVVVSAIVPVDKAQLLEHEKRKSIPLQLTIIFEDGSSQVIEMTNDGTKISFKMRGR